MIVETYKAEETFKLAYKLAKKAKAGEIYCLNGDLGVGKTVFTQGFAAGLDVTEIVNSPTFTIIQEYDTGRIPLYHFDVYRIAELDEMYELGYEEYFYGEGVCLIEWSSLINEIIPENACEIRISKDLEKGFEYRQIEIIKNKSS